MSTRTTPAPAPAAHRLLDSRVDVKIVLSALWISTLFVFAYVDIFGFWRADVVRGALEGSVPGVGFEIDQAFLTFTTIYILLPSLMVAASLLLPARVNRVAQMTLAVLYALSIMVSMIGESWAYYLLGSVVELALLAGVVWKAWTWPREHGAV